MSVRVERASESASVRVECASVRVECASERARVRVEYASVRGRTKQIFHSCVQQAHRQKMLRTWYTANLRRRKLG